MRLYWIILVAIGLHACHKSPIDDDIIVDPSEDTTTVSPKQNVVWQFAHTDDTTEIASNTPVIIEDKVMFVTQFNQPYDELFALNKETGDLEWYWDNDFNRGIPSIGCTHAHGSSLVITDGLYVYNVNANTGKTTWHTANQGGSRPISLIGEYVYDNATSGGLEYDEAYLLRSPINAPNWDTLFSNTKAKNGGLRPGLVAPALWVDPQGDSILIFHGRDLRFTPITTDLDLYAFNLKTCKLEWHHQDVGRNNLGTLQPPLIHDNKIYLKDSEHVICFSAFTGEELWVQGPMSGNGSCEMIIAENKLFVNPDGAEIMALDLETGTKLWYRSGSEAPASARSLVYYKGLIYTNGISGTSSRLHAFRASDGELVWTMDPPNRPAYPSSGFANTEGGLAIDQDLGYLYVSDGFFAMCIRLP